MFKKLSFLLLFSFTLIACKKESLEDHYIKTFLPKVLTLDSSDIADFKKHMVFNEDGNLTSWDSDILEKAYTTEDDYTFVLLGIYNKLGMNPSKIVLVDSTSNERVLQPGFLDIHGNKLPLSEVANWDALFYITSTNCGICIQDFQQMNKLAAKHANKRIKFVAIFDKAQNIENYKKGTSFQTLGFLNEDWIILQKNIFLPYLTQQYEDSLGFPFIFFRKDGIDLGQYPKSSDKLEVNQYILNKYEVKNDQ
ncbi:hypothetical protein ACPDHL_11860 [Myroides sp. C15-4]|uniref:hypothetical protein n=1 Tax=Myroides sp. C15-4 TaxID=3400532 RepID=UPI003D2F70D3